MQSWTKYAPFERSFFVLLWTWTIRKKGKMLHSRWKFVQNVNAPFWNGANFLERESVQNININFIDCSVLNKNNSQKGKILRWRWNLVQNITAPFWNGAKFSKRESVQEQNINMNLSTVLFWTRTIRKKGKMLRSKWNSFKI